MNQLRFDSGLGCYSVSAAPDSVWISKGMGTHCLQVRLQVGIPEVGESAGRLLLLETVLAAPDTGHGPRMPLACANVALAFNSDGEIRPPTLQTRSPTPQLHALEQQRNGDLRLELQGRGIPPEADPARFPGSVAGHSTSPSPRAGGASSSPTWAGRWGSTRRSRSPTATSWGNGCRFLREAQRLLGETRPPGML